MMLYRSLVLGLVGALILIQVDRAVHAPRVVRIANTGNVAPPETPTVVDVSRDALAAAGRDPSTVGLDRGERITAVDSLAVRDGGIALRDALDGAAPGTFVDLEIARGGAARRVLVLLH